MRILQTIIILLTIFTITSFANAVDEPEKNVTASSNERIFFKDKGLDFEFRRALGYAISGGADINECFQTARRITEGDDESWYKEWKATADRVFKSGESSLLKGHTQSAVEAFLRASNYYRIAEFYLHGKPEDPRILQTWGKSRNAFLQAVPYMEHVIVPIKIPYEGTSLPGYFCRPDTKSKPRKTLILQTGFDGTGEELYFEVAFFALKRGYNVLIFEGPGQGGALREQKLYFRPDWQNVVTPVVDYADTLPWVDINKLAIMGISMGGYLVPKAAAYEHRLSALIANTGVYSLVDPKNVPPREELEKEAKAINEAIRDKMKKNASMRWSMNNGMFTFGKKSPAEFMQAYWNYTMEGAAQLIECPTLIVDNENDEFFTIQAKQLYDALQCPKTYLLFTNEDAAGNHCQMGALGISNMKILDWLDETLD